MNQIGERLDRLPFSHFHRKLLLIGGLGYTFDAMDSASLAFILPVLREMWHLSSADVGLLASSTYIGYLFGAFSSGVAGDIVGRKVIMMSALGIYTGASFLCVFAEDPYTFFALRVLAGFGTGAESAIIAPYLAEFVGKRYRGKFTVALAGFFSFGYVLAALLGYFIIGQNWGSYKTLLIVTALPVLMVLWWRRMLPESPRWLVSHGRIAEAETAVARIEAEVQQAGHTLEPPVPSTAPAPEQAGGTIWTNLSTLWSPGLARTTAMCWFLWIAMAFSYYAFFTWLPSLLVQSGMTIAKSFGFSLAIYSAQVPGYFSAAFLSERLGRRALIACYATSGALSAGALALATSETQIIVAAMALSFSMNGAFGGLYAYTSELFPTRVRATGMGTSSSVGRLGAIGAPILVGMIFPILGFAGVFAMTTVVLALGAFIVLVFGVHTKGRSLEEIEQEIPAVRAPAKNGESARE